MDMTNFSGVFHPNTQLIRKSCIFSTQVDKDLVMLDESNGLYFSFNSIAGKIWQLLEKPLTYHQLLQSLMDLYEVSYQQCQQDTEKFLNQLLEHDLIQSTQAA